MTNDEDAQGDACAASSAFGIRHSTLLPCRLIVDPPQAGAWNMAVDEALLESAINDGVATLRFYQWSEPTLSLGYFQKLADREHHSASRDCTVVRRHSGGGAIIHDRELTYSLALPPNSPPVADPEQVYRLAHEALLVALGELLPASEECFAANLCAAAIIRPRGAEPFLCFQRRARCDVLLPAGAEPAGAIEGKHKVCGSAQRKRQGAVLQHGSLLLSRSPAAPELPGLKELLGVDLTASQINALWAEQIGERLGLKFRQDEPSSAEAQRASELVQEKFSAEMWISRR